MSVRKVLEMFGLTPINHLIQVQQTYSKEISELNKKLEIERDIKRALCRNLGSHLIDISHMEKSEKFERVGRNLRTDENAQLRDIEEGSRLFYEWFERQSQTEIVKTN